MCHLYLYIYIDIYIYTCIYIYISQFHSNRLLFHYIRSLSLPDMEESVFHVTTEDGTFFARPLACFTNARSISPNGMLLTALPEVGLWQQHSLPIYYVLCVCESIQFTPLGTKL